MHLESLTLRGFKSFAASTTLRFEPGITAVVGPNGSGKSNVVDAIAWVLGEQGAKSLRGGKMEDVIFAGTSGRPPLGRAEVILTIDNSDEALPIEAAQVTISRLMYRSGVSEYAINGTTCRLLDVQELLSDSGIGREMHVIVGQGQLDAVLQSRPEDRRAYIEEAAGVLKHRKRKEKALRKLEAMQGNLDRLTDLTAELGRQLGPLGRQAEVARRASTIQADLRDARLRLIADDALTLADALAAEAADEELIRTRRTEVERDAAVVRQELAELEAAVARDATATSAAADVYYRLVGIRDRLASIVTLAGERASHLDQVQLTTTGPDPDELDGDAARHSAEAAALADELASARTALTDAGAQRAEAESALASHDAAERDAARRHADRRERRARLTGRLETARMKAGAATAEVQRLAAARDEARARADAARASFAELEAGLAGLDEGEEDLDQSFESAASALATAEALVADFDAAARAGEADRARAEARRDALALTLTRKDGAAALAAAGGPVLGALFQRISVADGASAALAAALGPVADAVLVDSVRSAVDSMAALRRTSGGRATLLVAGSAASNPPPAPPGGTSLASLISGDAGAVAAIAPFVEHVAVVDTLADAERFVSAHPDWRAVTRDGDLVGPSLSAGGSDDQPSLLALQADHDDAVRAVDAAIAAREQALFALAGANSRLADARAAHDDALSRLHDSDARLAAIAEQLGALSSTARAAAAEADRLETARTRAAEAASAAASEAGELEALVAQADTDADQPEVVDPEVRGQLATRLERARSREVDARLAVSSLTERQRSAADRAAALARQAEAERAARAAAEEAAEQRRIASLRAHDVVRRGRAILTRLAGAVDAGLAQRVAVDAARVAHEHALVAVRARHAEITAELESLTVAEHRDEMARTESRLRLEALLQRAMDEFGVDADELRRTYAPDVAVPPSEDGGEPGSYDRAEQQNRARKAERALAQLGRINPLAMEEFDALTERHRFLSAQLDDLKTTRRDLLTVIKDVDERVEQVFTEAFADTAREFETVFATLFPGGEGHLLLTDPSNMATTGVEVTARPAGKTVQRLSLLSGGERSLTALALLVAIFRARPSPFYVLDEVEAALDGPNLGRLVGLFAELRGASQLIVITHQTRTMEAADALYGVTMRGDGVSQVVSARLRDRADAPAPAAH